MHRNNILSVSYWTGMQEKVIDTAIYVPIYKALPWCRTVINLSATVQRIGDLPSDKSKKQFFLFRVKHYYVPACKKQKKMFYELFTSEYIHLLLQRYNNLISFLHITHITQRHFIIHVLSVYFLKFITHVGR